MRNIKRMKWMAVPVLGAFYGGIYACGGDAVTTPVNVLDSSVKDTSNGADTSNVPDTSVADTSPGVDAADANMPDTAPYCVVPYGCAAYACASTDGGVADAGLAVSNGATSSPGPRGVFDAGGDGGGANEAYSFTTADFVTGIDPAKVFPQGATDRTLVLWENSASTGTSQTFFNYGTFAAGQRFGLLNGGGNHEYMVGEGHDLNGTKNPTDSTWHHIAVTYTNNTATLYFDGKLDVSGAPGGALTTTGYVFAIGQTVTVPAREPLKGAVSDVRVYNRVLTAQEIASLATFTGNGANPEALRKSNSGLVFWLPLFNMDPSIMLNRCAN